MYAIPNKSQYKRDNFQPSPQRTKPLAPISHSNTSPRLLVKRSLAIPTLKSKLVRQHGLARKRIDHPKGILISRSLEINGPNQAANLEVLIDKTLVDVGPDVAGVIEALALGEGEDQGAGAHGARGDVEVEVLGGDGGALLLEDEVAGGGGPDGGAGAFGGFGGGGGDGEGRSDGGEEECGELHFGWFGGLFVLSFDV